MTELDLLRALLLLSLVVAPFATHWFFLPHSRGLAMCHAVAFVCAAAGLLGPAPWFSLGWLLFCVVSFATFLRRLHTARGVAALRSPYVLAKCVPFAFSIIAATWLVGGANELRILGYDASFSYYAALHGNVLGWTIVGALALLASTTQSRVHRRLYLVSVAVCFASFLIIAVGIDEWPALKPYGVLGLSIVIPASQVALLRQTWSRHWAAFALGSVSLIGLVLTLALAWLHELAMLTFIGPGSMPAMVSLHGALNGVIVAPSLAWAAVLVARRYQGEVGPPVG